MTNNTESSTASSCRTYLASIFTLDKYIAFLFKVRYISLFIWIAAGGTSAAFFMQFIADCSQEFDAPEGTPAFTATNMMKKSFPSFVETMDLVIFLESTAPEGILLTDMTQNTTKCVEKFLSDVGTELSAEGSPFKNNLESYQSYYSLNSVGITSLANRLMDSKGRSTIAPIRLWGGFATKEGMNVGLDLEKFVKNIATAHVLSDARCAASIQVVGVPLLVNEALEASAADMGKSDGIVLPIALLVMAVTVRSLRLMILPCVTVGLSLAVSFAIMCGFTRVMTVSSAAPSLMMSLGICMSIDYCLFIVSRYVQEVRQGMTGHALVAKVVGASGHTILVSGSTLMLSLIALVFFPLNILQSFGWGCSITVLIALVVALTLCPTILLTFPTFFENGAKNMNYPPWVPSRIVRFLNFEEPVRTCVTEENLLDGSAEDPVHRVDTVPNCERNASDLGIDRGACSTSASGRIADASAVTIADRQSAYLTNETPASPIAKEEKCLIPAQQDANASCVLDGASPEDLIRYNKTIDGTVFRFLHRTTLFPFNIISFVLTCIVACGMGCALLEFRITDSFALNLPRGYTITDSYLRLVDVFGYSYMYPYQIMFHLDEAGADAAGALGLLDSANFNYSQGALRFINADTQIPGGLNVGDYSGVLALDKQWVEHAQIATCLSYFSATHAENLLTLQSSSANANCTMELLSLLMGTVTKSRDSLLMMLFIHVDPIGNDGDPFYRRLLKLIEVYGEWVAAGAVPNPESEHYSSQLAALKVIGANISAAVESSPHISLYLSGIGPQSMDAVDTVYRLFPIVIAVSGVVVLLVVGFSFRSIAVPLRCLLSIALTELFVFGWVALVYSLPTGVLNWTGSPAVHTSQAIPWIDPIVAFSVVLGIALDYDVFLLTRVFELRMGPKSPNQTIANETSPLMSNKSHRGCLSTHDAILVGLCDTGPIITSAGIIMAIAFFGMLLSAMTLLNVLGMFLVTAVLFDTFVIRTFLGPSALSLLGEMSWWPRKPPIVETHFSHNRSDKQK